MTPILETTRLRLREFAHADLDPLVTMVADGEQMAYYPHPRTRHDASIWLDRNLTLYANVGYGFWVIESPDGEFFGYCGIRPLTIEGIQEVEMGWHTKKQVWGQGVATEAATACRDLAFGRFGIERLVATIDPAHRASLRVATKLGMSRDREAVLDGWACVIYAIHSSNIEFRKSSAWRPSRAR